MTKPPKAFISYSHADREIAKRITDTLRKEGINVWFDRYEILVNDSLIQKIFQEGLAEADAFIVILSKDSINSKWVQHELDTAMIKRIEGATRVIPVLIDKVDIPEPLKPIKYIDLSQDFDDTIRELQKAIFKVHERPPVGEPPDFVKNLEPVSGLSGLGTKLGRFLITTGKHEIGNEETLRPAELAEQFSFSPEEMNDAIDELESLGLIETTNFLGTHPYSHGDVTPTYALFLHFKENGVEYDPEEDIKAVASTIVADKNVGGHGIAQRTELSPLRINRAVAYLKDYGIAQVFEELGTAPFDFSIVDATGMTRRFVSENCN